MTKVNTWWNSKSKIKSPCMDCEERTLGCHGNCESYSKYQKDIKEIHRRERLDLSNRTGEEWR